MSSSSFGVIVAYESNVETWTEALIFFGLFKGCQVEIKLEVVCSKQSDPSGIYYANIVVPPTLQVILENWDPDATLRFADGTRARMSLGALQQNLTRGALRITNPLPLQSRQNFDSLQGKELVKTVAKMQEATRRRQQVTIDPENKSDAAKRAHKELEDARQAKIDQQHCLNTLSMAGHVSAESTVSLETSIKALTSEIEKLDQKFVEETALDESSRDEVYGMMITNIRGLEIQQNSKIQDLNVRVGQNHRNCKDKANKNHGQMLHLQRDMHHLKTSFAGAEAAQANKWCEMQDFQASVTVDVGEIKNRLDVSERNSVRRQSLDMDGLSESTRTAKMQLEEARAAHTQVQQKLDHVASLPDMEELARQIRTRLLIKDAEVEARKLAWEKEKQHDVAVRGLNDHILQRLVGEMQSLKSQNEQLEIHVNTLEAAALVTADVTRAEFDVMTDKFKNDISRLEQATRETLPASAPNAADNLQAKVAAIVEAFDNLQSQVNGGTARVEVLEATMQDDFQQMEAKIKDFQAIFHSGGPAPAPASMQSLKAEILEDKDCVDNGKLSSQDEALQQREILMASKPDPRLLAKNALVAKTQARRSQSAPAKSVHWDRLPDTSRCSYAEQNLCSISVNTGPGHKCSRPSQWQMKGQGYCCEHHKKALIALA